MKHTIGSVLQFTPAAPGVEVSITFPNDKHTLSYPLIGWAVVVTWNGRNIEDLRDHDDYGEQETRIIPVTLIDGYAATLHDLQADHPGTTYEVGR